MPIKRLWYQNLLVGMKVMTDKGEGQVVYVNHQKHTAEGTVSGPAGTDSVLERDRQELMTDTRQLREGERLDDLVRDGMKIIQRTDQFCFSMDSVLLAHYVNIRAKDRIVDLGTGSE